MPLIPPGATEISLLDEHGQPCSTMIDAELDRQMEPWAKEDPRTHLRRREGARMMIEAEAAEQAEKFGKTADEVRLIDLRKSEEALDYAAHIDRSQRAQEREAIRNERREIERRRIEDHLKATMSAPASTLIAAAADTVKHCPNPRAAIESAARNVLWAIENNYPITSGSEWFLADMQASIAWAQASRTAALQAAG